MVGLLQKVIPAKKFKWVMSSVDSEERKDIQTKYSCQEPFGKVYDEEKGSNHHNYEIQKIYIYIKKVL